MEDATGRPSPSSKWLHFTCPEVAAFARPLTTRPDAVALRSTAFDGASSSPAAPEIIGISIRGSSLPEHDGQPQAVRLCQPRRSPFLPYASHRGLPAASPRLQPLGNSLPGDACPSSNFRAAMPLLIQSETLEASRLVRIEIALGSHAHSIAREAQLSS